jgi:hypothetical protein
VRRERREPRADTAATAVVAFAVTNFDYIIVLSVCSPAATCASTRYRIEAAAGGHS